jgi:hypothetical protein
MVKGEANQERSMKRVGQLDFNGLEGAIFKKRERFLTTE